MTGYSGSSIVLISRDGFAGTVTLELLNLPPGVTSQTAQSVTLAANAVSSTPFKLQAASTTPPGDYFATVRARSGALVHDVAYPIHVVDPLPPPAPDVEAPFAVVGGGQYEATVALLPAGGPTAPAGGLVVNLSTDDTAVATVPASVTIPEGATQASFTVSTSAVTARKFPSIRAAISPNGWSGSDPMFVEPSATLSQVDVFPTSVVGGDTSGLGVSLSAQVAEPTVVDLSSSDPAVATVPANVTVPAGSSGTSVAIRSAAVTKDTVVAIPATFSGVTKIVYLGVTVTASPPPGGTVSVKRAQYDNANKVLQVEVTSSDAIPSEVSAVFVASTGQKIGTLTNSGGTFKGTFAWPVNPQEITIANSRGWSVNAFVTAK